MSPIDKIKLEQAKKALERNFELAEKHPIFADKFLNQAIAAEQIIKTLSKLR